MPVCEVLAALVPERVLPFASGDSRKRWLRPSPARPKALLETAVGRRKASAPAPGDPGGPGFLACRGRERSQGARRIARCGTRRCVFWRPASFIYGEAQGTGVVRHNPDAKGIAGMMSIILHR